MKNLKDILEKLKIDDIVLGEKFPIDGPIDAMIEFLEGQGFKQISSSGYINELADSEKSRCFKVYSDKSSIKAHTNKFSIWFADTSKEVTSKNNPIFFIDGIFSDELEYTVYYCHLSNHSSIYIIKNDKKKFLEELNKQFGWK